MKYTNALCEKDFTIIKQLNQFTDPDTFMESVNKLINNVSFQTAEHLKTLYPIRQKELSKYSHYKEIAKEFSDCTIRLTYKRFDNTTPLKNYIVYGEKIVDKGKEISLFYRTYKKQFGLNALLQEARFDYFDVCQTNEDYTKARIIASVRQRSIERYYRIKEFQEGTVNLNRVADKYFEETGEKLLNNDISLTMEIAYDYDFRCFITIIYENGKNIGRTWNFQRIHFLSQYIDRKTIRTLLLYYIGFTPEQIEHFFLINHYKK